MESKEVQVKTIGIVLPYVKFRGTEKQSLNISKGLMKKGFRVLLFNVQGWGYSSELFEESGIKVINVGNPIHEGEKYISKYRLFKLAYLVKKHNCSVLLSRAGMTNQICALAARLNHIPSIVVISSRVKKPEPEVKKNKLKQKIKLFRFLSKNGFANYFVTVSLEGADNLKSTFSSLSDRIIAIQNGIDIEEVFKKSLDSIEIKKTDRFRLCYAGSIEFNRKGMDILIDTLYELVYEKKQKDIELLLIGTGDDEIALKKIIKEKNLKDFVIFAGEQQNPYPFIKNSDLFILPSRREGLPNVLLEAMALGVCSIAFDCPTGPGEIIINNENGILLPPGNKNKLVDAILLLKENSELRKKFSLNGRETIIKKFAYERMIDGYAELLKAVLKDPVLNKI